MTAQTLTFGQRLCTSRVCARPGCGILFLPNHNGCQRYCDAECKRLESIRRQVERDRRPPQPVRPCKRCGCIFKPVSFRNVVCRSKVCQRRPDKLSVRISEEMMQALQTEATRLERSVSWVAQRCVALALQKASAK